MEIKANTNVPVINSLRGLAASLVCFYHFVCTTSGFFSDKTVLRIFSYGNLGVQMFFVISGIVIPLSMIKGRYDYPSWFRFIAKRFVRIEPPFLVSIIIGVLYLNLRNYIPWTVKTDISPSIKEISLHIGYLVPFFKDARWINPAYWTLAVEFQYYLTLSVLFPLVLKFKMPGRFIFYILFLLPSLYFTDTAFFPIWTPLFMVGILYALFFTGMIKQLEYIAGLVVCAVLIYFNIGLTELITCGITLTIIQFFTNFSWKFGEFFGNISYSLYLLHSIIGSAAVNFLSHRFTVSWQKVLVVIFGYALSVFSAWLLYLVIEKPSQAWSKKIKYNQ